MSKFTLVTAAWRSDGLKKVIKCIDAQTVIDWQHIIVNDNSLEVRKFLEENDYFEEDNKRHVIDLHTRTHWFGCYARNVGVQIAFTYIKNKHREYGNEYIVFLDDDNYISPTHLEVISKTIEENKNSPLIGFDILRVGKKDPNNKKYIRCELYPQLCDLGSFAYRTDMFEKYGYFRARKEKKIQFDWEFIDKIIKGEGVDKIKIIHTDDPTFHFYHKKY